MEFNRKTKTLKGVPLGLYATLVLLVVGTFSFRYNNSVKTQSSTIDPEIAIDKLGTTQQEQETIDTISLTKPDIYIAAPEKEVVTTEKEAASEKKDKEEAIAKKEPEKTEDNPSKTIKNNTLGKDRKITAYIPGTMGQSGKLPHHNCKTKGELVMAISVDANGNVTSAKRSKGLSDICNITAAVIWLKKYVKAEKQSNQTSTGTYSIKF